jgi:predicted transcriptional regulator
MKKLIISLKTPSQALSSFKKAWADAEKKKIKRPHFEIAFDNKKDFEKFVKNIDILISIQNLKPSSIYELAKMLGKNQSNLNKLISFFEFYGIVKIQEETINNRRVKKPIVDYKRIEFDLDAA